MATTAQNQRYYSKRKQLQPLREIPQIPHSLAHVIADNTLTADQEREADAAIKRGCAALHERRAFKEDAKPAYTPREFSTEPNSRNIFVVRCA
jgi:hypothetical protein